MLKFRMYLRLLKGAVTKRKSRMIISLLAIALGSAVISALVSVYFDMGVKMRKELRTYGANVVVAPSPKKDFISAKELESVMDTLPKDNLIGYAPYIYGVVRTGDSRLVAAGTDFTQVKKVSPYWHVEGQWPDSDTKSILVGIAAAWQLGVGPGDSIIIMSEENKQWLKAEVTGVVETGGTEDNQIIMSLNIAQQLLDKKGKINIAYASVLGDIGTVERWTTNLDSDLRVEPVKKISQAEGKILERIRSLVYLVVIIILGSTLLCVTTTAMAMIMERRQEIALKKALGADNKSVIYEFLGESTVLGLLGGAAGWIIGYGLAQGIGLSVFDSLVSFRWQVIPAVLATAVLLSCIACLIPINKALAVDPAVTLKGE